jgi:hypothetical protein
MDDYPEVKIDDVKSILEMFSYPFNFLKRGKRKYYDYILENIFKPIPGGDVVELENLTDFDTKIEKIYCYQEGENDKEDWFLFAKLTNGIFIVYSATCDYSGFDCRGGMELQASRDFNTIFEKGLADPDRELYYSQNK